MISPPSVEFDSLDNFGMSGQLSSPQVQEATAIEITQDGQIFLTRPTPVSTTASCGLAQITYDS